MSTIEEALKKHASTSVEDESESQTAAPVDKKHPSRSASVKQEESPQVHIPLEDLERQGYVSVLGNRCAINEEFRGIKQKVLSNAFGPLSKSLPNANLIMISSATASEGKSFCALNLALSIALEQDKTVLLVDCDVLNPSLDKKMQIKPKQGLIEYLSSEADDVQDIIHLTNLEKLRFITAGRQHHLSSELLASEKMAQLAEEFVSRYPDRLVIMDCPPLLGINETSVLSTLAGQILIVVEEGRSAMANIKTAVSSLDRNKAIGFVLNKSTQPDNSNYGYGYGYSYGR
ncbi:Receptor protein-tyrosine kinase [Saliniradius amylolyticus]|uniref:non-specific protein-tyrosine kinase n=1 Tax=Saliniradius amylolyticus TaxID=2183582 RepID=A0A2S2E352_9ALTE|nr:XrtA-associated tyrosine autokinase [Saliniradius amylolyticus]AWL11680.1 Receptor protein-tyrosine kinase [Saliniradius amylolyticus]